MPTPLTYPGVYVEEIPSGVRTITGVATSVTAFIGRARKGPTDTAVDLTSYADFERIFGGLWLDSAMSFAVRDFFLNGGTRAVIVRLHRASAVLAREALLAAAGAEANGKDAVAKAKAKNDEIQAAADKSDADKKAAAATFKALDDALEDGDDKAKVTSAIDNVRATVNPSDLRTLNVGDAAGKPLKFQPSSPGKWGANLQVRARNAAKGIGLSGEGLFDLTVIESGTGGSTETFINLSLAKSATRRVDRILAAESQLLRWDPSVNLDTEPAMALPDLSKWPGDEVGTAAAKLEDLLKKSPDPSSQTAKDASKAVTDAADKAAKDSSDGIEITSYEFMPANAQTEKKGLFALEQLFTRDGIFNLLCIPPYNSQLNAPASDVDVGVIATADAYCKKRRAMLIVDPPSKWKSIQHANDGFSADPDQIGARSRNAAIFFPRVRQPNPLRGDQLEDFAPCGVVAGIFARTDGERGVWKAPAGLDAALVGVSALSLPMTDEENGILNPLGINCLRTFPVYGRVIWGSRTLRGADAFADEYKYIAVRRTALYIEESLYRGLKWVVYEPNAEPLWAQIRLNVGAFMHSLFRQNAFGAASARDAYYVRCDSSTTTETDINLGVVNIEVGFKPLKPAEFVVLKLQQMAGQIET